MSGTRVTSIFNDRAGNLPAKVAGIYVFLFVCNAAAWVWAWITFRHSIILLGLAGLAYSFGLRHAFDADHIAAIDNTTRRLMTDDRRPFGVGFFFSLGHSTIVFAMTLALALATRYVTQKLPALQSFGHVFGTTVSGLFLYAIGILNLLVMIDTVRMFRALRRGAVSPDAAGAALTAGGVMTRLFNRVFRIATKS